jgi:uncharacterized protein YukE
MKTYTLLDTGGNETNLRLDAEEMSEKDQASMQHTHYAEITASQTTKLDKMWHGQSFSYHTLDIDQHSGKTTKAGLYFTPQ